ncbi:MAG: DUF2946 family protein [Alphaproteobacteria bacterium]
MKFLTHCLVILALLTAGISPACAFMSGISGKMMDLEICASDGSVQIVRVSADEYDPNAAPDIPEVSQFKDCAVCVHSSMAKVSVEPTSFYNAQNSGIQSARVLKDFILIVTPSKAVIPRAPPISYLL